MDPIPPTTLASRRRAPWMAALLLATNLILLRWTWVQAAHRSPSTIPSPSAAAGVEAAVARVRSIVETRDLTRAERRVETLGWLFDWDEAHAMAKRLGRPIFLLTLLGELDGRC